MPMKRKTSTYVVFDVLTAVAMLLVCCLGACAHFPSVYEPLRGFDSKSLESFATVDPDGTGLTLADGRHLGVRVIAGMKVQRFGEVGFGSADGLCGYYDQAANTITIAIDTPGCNYGDPTPTLLHEMGHTLGLQHGRGIMSHDYQGPVSAWDLAAFEVDLGELRKQQEVMR